MSLLLMEAMMPKSRISDDTLNVVYEEVTEILGDVQNLLTLQRAEYFVSVEEGLGELRDKVDRFKKRLHCV